MKKNKHNGIIYTTSFLSWEKSLPALLNKAGLAEHLAEHIPQGKTILIKPNLVEVLRPPITTPVALVREIVEYLQMYTDNPIVIGE